METSIIVILTHNYNQETKVFDFLFQARRWAEISGYILVDTTVPNVYRVTWYSNKD